MSLAKIKELKSQIQAARERMQKEGNEALKSAFKEFFDLVPEAEAIMWTQYTPYFNDGDSCEFGVNDLGLKLTREAYKALVNPGLDDGDLEYQDLMDSYYESMEWNLKKSADKRAKEIAALFEEFVNSVSDQDLFLYSFGDHAEIKATRSGFEIDECRHD